MLTKEDLEGLGYEFTEEPGKPSKFHWENQFASSDVFFDYEEDCVKDAAEHAVKNNDLHRCDNCGKVHCQPDLRMVEDYSLRVEPGNPAPSGECPDCGALCYPLEKQAYFDPFQKLVLETYNAGDHAVHQPSDIEDCGDTLLSFLLVELSDNEGCDSFETAVNRLDTAIRQMEEVRSAFINAAVS